MFFKLSYNKLMKHLIPQDIKNIYHFLVALAAVLWHGVPARKLTVIGVTGTDGKTTTSTMVHEILKTAGKKSALISTVAAEIGDEAIDTGFHVTTPSPWQLQRLIKRIAGEGYEFLVLESTSHGFDQHRLLGTNIKLAIITNITREHLDYHKTYERYLAAKAKIFKRAVVAVLNQDDMSYKPLLEKLEARPVKVLTYSLGLKDKDKVAPYFPEEYNQANALAALTLARYLKIDDADSLRAFAGFKGITGRMEEIQNDAGIRVVVDFAHTPNALEQALKSLKGQTKGRLIAVYGSAGLRDHEKRPLMGKKGVQLADLVVLTAEDPRTERVSRIIEQMKAKLTSEELNRVKVITDRGEAIESAIVEMAEAGDTVAILGKGHERSMNLDGKTETPWSDQEEAAKALKKLALNDQLANSN